MEEEKIVSISVVGKKENNEFKGTVDELVDTIVKDLEEGYQSDLESFDVYAQRVREEVHVNMEEFRTHFLKGYDVLLEELTQWYGGTKTTEEKLPPNAITL